MAERAPLVTGFFDPATKSVSYLVADPASGRAAVIDSVLDYEQGGPGAGTAMADRILAAARGFRLDWILETHTHADHLSAALYLKQEAGGRIGTGAKVVDIQRCWQTKLELGPDFTADGSQFDRLFHDGERFEIGTLVATAWHTPGHTPSCVTYIIEGRDGSPCAFVGDVLFMPDRGAGRADRKSGDVRALYRSIRRVLSLPPATRLFVGHDDPPAGRSPSFETTVAEQRERNIHVRDGIGEDEFVAACTARDKALGKPPFLFSAVQVNIRAGGLPPSGELGLSYMRTPANRP